MYISEFSEKGCSMEKQSGRPLGLWALALGGFGIGLTELSVMGILPEIARRFAVGADTAGTLVSAYAIAVAVGAVFLTLAVRKFDRKNVLIGLVALFIIGNLVCALASSFAMLMIGRIIAALCHGAYFSVGSVVASDMVSENKRAGAISLMFAGLTVSNVIGTPFGAFLGQRWGWNMIFWVLTGIGFLVLLSTWLLVEKTPAGQDASLSGQLAALRRPSLWVSVAVSVLTFAALIGPYTYVSYILTGVAGFSSGLLPVLLVVYGIGTFIGNMIGGKAADSSLDGSLLTFTLGLAVVLALFGFLARLPWVSLPALVLWGVLGYATAPGLQLRLMNHAQGAPTIGSSMNIAALNVGNAIGAWLCGIPLGSGGTNAKGALWTGAALAVAAAIVLLLSTKFERHSTISKQA